MQQTHGRLLEYRFYVEAQAPDRRFGLNSVPRLKTPYRDGTTDVVFEPLDFIARLAALVPSPRVNLTRYHGVFAPNHRLREQVTPARRGRRSAETTDEPAPAPHVSMTWAQRLKRVFKIDILTCEHCGEYRKNKPPFRMLATGCLA